MPNPASYNADVEVIDVDAEENDAIVGSQECTYPAASGDAPPLNRIIQFDLPRNDVDDENQSYVSSAENDKNETADCHV